MLIDVEKTLFELRIFNLRIKLEMEEENPKQWDQRVSNDL